MVRGKRGTGATGGIQGGQCVRYRGKGGIGDDWRDSGDSGETGGESVGYRGVAGERCRVRGGSKI